jgi:hypothetical protein
MLVFVYYKVGSEGSCTKSSFIIFIGRETQLDDEIKGNDFDERVS